MENITLSDQFERSCIELSKSYITYENNDIQVHIYPRRQSSANWIDRWMEPCFKISNILNKTPSFIFKPYGQEKDHHCHQIWKPEMRFHFSYDFEEWFPLKNLEILKDALKAFHHEPFSQNEVFIARSWPINVTQIGKRIEGLEHQFPNSIYPLDYDYILNNKEPFNFPAKKFVLEEIKECLNEKGDTIPKTPLYGFKINTNRKEEKPIILFSSGIHAGEDIGTLMMYEFLKWLLDPTMEAQYLLNKYQYFVYPLINPSGRYAGFWRNAPGHFDDTNRNWLESQQEIECVKKTKQIIASEIKSRHVSICLDFHSSPSGETMQVAARNTLPISTQFRDLVNSKLNVSKVGIYGDINNKAGLLGTFADMARKDLKANMSLVIEASDQSTPVSPSVFKPYAKAFGEAIYQMDQQHLFD